MVFALNKNFNAAAAKIYRNPSGHCSICQLAAEKILEISGGYSTKLFSLLLAKLS